MKLRDLCSLCDFDLKRTHTQSEYWVKLLEVLTIYQRNDLSLLGPVADSYLPQNSRVGGRGLYSKTWSMGEYQRQRHKLALKFSWPNTKNLWSLTPLLLWILKEIHGSREDFILLLSRRSRSPCCRAFIQMCLLSLYREFSKTPGSRVQCFQNIKAPSRIRPLSL